MAHPKGHQQPRRGAKRFVGGFTGGACSRPKSSAPPAVWSPRLPDSLAYWNTVLMPQALKAQTIADREAATKNDGVAKLYELTADRLWHLAPSFCLFPSDFGEGANYVTTKNGRAKSSRDGSHPGITRSNGHNLRPLQSIGWLAVSLVVSADAYLVGIPQTLIPRSGTQRPSFVVTQVHTERAFKAANLLQGR